MDYSQPQITWANGNQQPHWEDPEEVREVRRELAVRDPLVQASDVRRLRETLADAAMGRAVVIQAGDCAEDPVESTAGYVARKAGMIDMLAGALKMITHRPVVRAGRIAGQFAKPRSRATEQVGESLEVPVYRGHLVNSPEPDPTGRRPAPRRMLSGHDAAAEVMRHLGWRSACRTHADPPLWTSHEALLLDYEVPLTRRDDQGRFLLTSTHWPWIGERTRQLDGPHVDLLSQVVNPVACKVGPRVTVDELLQLCERLDPDRSPGRLTFIARMGADGVEERLPPLVAAARDAGHPVVWLSDPMHGNTTTTPDGLKTRFVQSIVHEIRGFQAAVRSVNGCPAGLHLEATPDNVVECVSQSADLDHLGDKYTTLCDPRLNLEQAVSAVSAWSG